MLGVCDSAAQGERGSTKASQLHNDGARTDPQPAACTHHPPINRVVPVTVPMRARDAMQGRDPDAARPTPAARLAALAPRRLPSRATVAAPTCRESSAAALSRTDAGARCDAGAIPMPRDPPRRGSTLGSRRPAEAALACHGRGSDVQQRKLGGGSCLLVAFSVRDTGAHATSDRQLHCEKNASERRRACHRSVQTDFCSRHGRGTQRRGRSDLYSASTFRVCERRAVSPDRRTEFRGGARDSPLLELAHRYAGSLANGASDAVQSVRPLGTDGLPSPTTSVQPTCTPIAIRAAERAQSSGGARAGLGGPRRIETDPKGPRNSGLQGATEASPRGELSGLAQGSPWKCRSMDGPQPATKHPERRLRF